MQLLPVAPFQETLNASACAPATLQMLLTYWNLPGKEKSDRELAREMGTDPEFGTSNETFLMHAKKHGLENTTKTEATFEDIQEWLDRKIPVVVDWFTPGRKDAPDGMMPDGHYSIVVGLDEKNIYLQDPEVGGLRTIPRKEFWRVWFDFTGNWIEKKNDMIIRWMAAVYPVKPA